MLNSFFEYADVQIISDTLAEFLVCKYKSGNLREADPVYLANEFLASNVWIEDICRADVRCSAELISSISKTIKSPYYLIPDKIIKSI